MPTSIQSESSTQGTNPGSQQDRQSPVWDVLGRGNPAGRALFNIYCGDIGGKAVGNQFSSQNLATLHRLLKRDGKLPQDQQPGKSRRLSLCRN